MSITLREDSFHARHIGPQQDEIAQMLSDVGATSLEELMGQIIPKGIELPNDLSLPEPLTESDYLSQLKEIASRNKVFRSFIGLGYTDTILPNVILRNILENPGWYTAYTPYQAEIAQGRMEALVNFQTMISDLTGMEIANASLLDEATAAAEAMSMLFASRSRAKQEATQYYVADGCHPQTLSLLQTRAEPLGIMLVTGPAEKVDVTDPHLFGLQLQYPESDGRILHLRPILEAAKENDLLSCVSADLLSLALLTPPGQMGADVVVGSSQRFGVPLGFGGPHAAFFATHSAFQRKLPGRIIGVTRDREGNPAYRMALQTREQHIRREKATSNICTAQVLLAVISGMYGVWHGAEGIKRIAQNVHSLAAITAEGLRRLGLKTRHETYFDTLRIEPLNANWTTKVREIAIRKEMNFRYFDDGSVGITFDEAKSLSDVQDILDVFAETATKSAVSANEIASELEGSADKLPAELRRTTTYMQHEVFEKFHSEHEMLRYLKRLENKDLSLTHSMISLGSCTMKLNATAEMIPVTWPEFGGIHPFAPDDQTKGYQKLFEDLGGWLEEITGFDAVSLQPNSGAQGEYAGLMVIRAYHHANGDTHRNVALIPSSAHGTNPASAVMAGMEVVVISCDERGNIDLNDLKTKIAQHGDRLSALMVTYPSTHGVFEEDIREICDLVHQAGGRVYMDGANMNAQVGLTSPAVIGADVCHLNLHKTFCIPHGGGGPGMGPIGVVKDLAPFLPGHPLVKTGGTEAITPISAAPFGSASILTISHAYIHMMGSSGLKKATQVAILNANYIMTRLKDHYKILYTGRNNRSAHEFILDIREFKQSAGIEATDVAKRLMDYGFHAPTMSFPVAGTLMIEPTESESKAELDRFCDAMIGIRNEIRAIEEGRSDREDNPLVNAPHTVRTAMSETWNHSYSREEAIFPLADQRFNKFWPSVSRVDDAYGDRNLVCTCLPMEAYSSEI